MHNTHTEKTTRNTIRGTAQYLLSLLIVLLAAGAAHAATTIPFADGFELYSVGSAIPTQSDAWDPLTPSGLVARADAHGYTPAPPLPAATHTQVGAFDSVTRLEFTGANNTLRYYKQFMVKPVPGDEPKTLSLVGLPDYAFYFNADGQIVIYHTILYLPSEDYSTNWTVLSHAPVNTSEWYKIQVCVDYRTASFQYPNADTMYEKFFQISLNDTPLSHPIGVQEPKFYRPGNGPFPGEDLNGSWFFSPDFSELANSQLREPGDPTGFGMEGVGTVDDLLVNFIPDDPTNTLTIGSTHGGATGAPPIPSTSSYPYGSNVVCSVSNAILPMGSSTQLVCRGWTNGTGMVAPQGTASSTTVVMNADSSLTWRWAYQFYLDTEATGEGSIDVGDGWYDDGTIVEITADPDDGKTFSGWQGDVAPANTNDNPLFLRMDKARSLTAVFSGDVAQYTTRGTPYDWLTSYGVSNHYETADTNDWDKDGAATWEEYAAGTEPDNAASVFVLQALDPQGAGYRLQWYGTTHHGVTNPFTILRGDTPDSGATWTTVQTGIGRSPDGTNTWDDPAPPSGNTFYRIEIPWP